MAKSDGLSARTRSNGVYARAVAAAGLVALGMAALWIGFWGVAAVSVAATALMAWEYGRLWSGKIGAKLAWDVFGVAGVLAAYAALGGQYPAYWFAGGYVALFCVSVVANVASDRKRWLLESMAPIYIGLAMLGFMYIYRSAGIYSIIYAFVITVSTDTGAYFIGCALGGPKLMPAVSPNKTWSGALGGLMCAFAAGTAYKIVLLWNLGGDDFSSVCVWAVASVVLSLLSEIGDLVESKMKRLAGVKDSSGMIPGHGGVLDRFDSMLFVAPALALLVAFTKIGYTGL